MFRFPYLTIWVFPERSKHVPAAEPLFLVTLHTYPDNDLCSEICQLTPLWAYSCNMSLHKADRTGSDFNSENAKSKEWEVLAIHTPSHFILTLIPRRKQWNQSLSSNKTFKIPLSLDRSGKGKSNQGFAMEIVISFPDLYRIPQDPKHPYSRLA